MRWPPGSPTVSVPRPRRPFGNVDVSAWSSRADAPPSPRTLYSPVAPRNGNAGTSSTATSAACRSSIRSATARPPAWPGSIGWGCQGRTSIPSAPSSAPRRRPRTTRRRSPRMLPFDLVLLGMGEDGHTASLFPGLPLEDDGLVIPVHGAPKPPAERVSLTPRALAASRSALIVVTGAGKRAALDDWRRGRPLPVSRVASLACATLVVDRDAWGPGSRRESCPVTHPVDGIPRPASGQPRGASDLGAL